MIETTTSTVYVCDGCGGRHQAQPDGSAMLAGTSIVDGGQATVQMWLCPACWTEANPFTTLAATKES